jgi:hypothetical protein
MIKNPAFVSAVLSVPILVLLGEVSAFAANEHSRKVSGEVTAVSVTDQTVVIKRSVTKGATELKLLVDSRSEVLIGKEKKSLSDVHVGDKVRGKYLNKDGKHVARTLYVSSTSGSEKKSGAVGSTEAQQPPIASPPLPQLPSTQSVPPGK